MNGRETIQASQRLTRRLLAVGLVLSSASVVSFLVGSTLAVMRVMNDLSLRAHHAAAPSTISESVVGGMVRLGEFGFGLGCLVTFIAVIRLVQEVHCDQTQRRRSTTPPPSR